MPRKSTGCALCRKRKVKCDEARPNCRRCTNYGAACPGYRDDLPYYNTTAAGSADYSFSEGESSRRYSQPDHPIHRTSPVQSQLSTQYGRSGSAESSEVESNAYRTRWNELFATVLGFHLPPTRELALMSRNPYANTRTDVNALDCLEKSALDAWQIVRSSPAYQQDSNSRLGGTDQQLQIQKQLLLGAIATIALCKTNNNMAMIYEATQRRQTVGLIDPQDSRQIADKITHDACLSWGIYHNVRHLSIVMGLLRRKRLYFAEPRCLDCTAAVAKVDALVALHDVAVQVPGVLQSLDPLLTASVCDSAELTNVCLNMCAMRKGLNDWHVWRQFVLGQSSYSINENASISSGLAGPGRQMSTTYHFPDSQSCTQYQLYWVLCVVFDSALRQASWKLRTSNPFDQIPRLQVSDRSEEQLGRDAYTAAIDFCKSLNHLTESQMSTIDRPITMLILLVREFFRHNGHVAEMTWITRLHVHLDASNQATSAAKRVIDAQLARILEHRLTDTTLSATGQQPSPGMLQDLHPIHGIQLHQQTASGTGWTSTNMVLREDLDFQRTPLLRLSNQEVAHLPVSTSFDASVPFAQQFQMMPTWEGGNAEMHSSFADSSGELLHSGDSSQMNYDPSAPEQFTWHDMQ